MLADSLLLGLSDGLGDTDADSEAEGLTLGLGLSDGDSLDEGDSLADGLGEALSLAEGETDADGDPLIANPRCAMADDPVVGTPASTTRRMPDVTVIVAATLFAGQLAVVWTVPSASACSPALVTIGPRVSRETASSNSSMCVRRAALLSPSARVI